MTFDVWFELTAAILIVQFGSAVYFLIWLNRTLPSSVLSRYSIGNRIAAIIQAGTTWNSKIDITDLGAFSSARRGFAWMILFLVVSVGIECALLVMVLADGS